MEWLMEFRPAPMNQPQPTGTLAEGFVTLDGEDYFRITSLQRLDPFLVSLASDTDLWMFVTSGGGLTAGRVDAEGSLFPYRTIDQLHEAHHHTGPLTLIQVDQENRAPIIWEPFSEANAESSLIERSLAKNSIGNRLVFEEISHELGLVFRYRWAGCDEFGWVRTATLENIGTAHIRANLLDGLRNILPHGAPLSLYQQSSNLVDAYKKSEVDPDTGLGIFSLTAGITDRAEALEVLRANTVWCCGLEDYRVHLSREAVRHFRHGRVLAEEHVLNGQRGNYLVSTTLELDPGEQTRWHLVGDVGRDHVQISQVRRRLQNDHDLVEAIDQSLQLAGENLRRNVASADGLQLSGRPASWWHHFANVLFNNMRGGVFTGNHDIPLADFVDFLHVRNHRVAARHRSLLKTWPEVMTVQQLGDAVRQAGDVDLERLGLEYLPLFFGRRHGDPSRPWNRFSIRVRDSHGEPAMHYEGNWRDIFQNWEALSTAFPGFLPSMVAKFVNASTVDGFNPYRLTRDGVDWETVSEDDPWSNIGYWGDHQIIYLLKLLEAMHSHDPRAIAAMLDDEIFSYAEVPYLIKPYADLLQDPGSSIEFDTERAERIEDRVAQNGTDGKLLTGSDGQVHHANFLEKLLVPALSKLSNLIPDAGIWMNTQRPEWNDANNALAGGGASVVTLCYLRRYLAFLADLLEDMPHRVLPLSAEIAEWLEQLEGTLESEQSMLAADELDARDRKRLMDELGEAFSAYRATVYAQGFSGVKDLSIHRIADFCRTALKFIDWGINANRRDDGLYHAYNLLEITDTGARVAHLPVMLEGQVAVLSSGALQPDEALRNLGALFASDLYRPDQHSFILYPERELPSFLAKNALAEERLADAPLLVDLLAAGDRSLVDRDAEGVIRFQGDFQNAHDLDEALEKLAHHELWSDAVERDRLTVLALFEEVFNHKSYTGRSGVMYGYEGLGCIYWHMVAKLLLAVQENVFEAERQDLTAAIQDDLKRMYFRVRSGIGYEKSVAEYGAFPTDPYSHTPSSGGAKQPGMTGQVKEEILTRLGELGVHVAGGVVCFKPSLLQAGEFMDSPEDFQYFDTQGTPDSLPLPAGSMAFTVCQVPVIYERVTGSAWVEVTFADGTTTEFTGSRLDVQVSAEVFNRSGRVERIRVGIPQESLRR